jgi:sigma-54 specific flagellar transcriptional regulator A
MPRDRRLSPEERSFFSLLAETVYANPFGSDQERLSRLLGRPASTGVVSQGEHYIELLPILEARLAPLRERGLTRIEHFHPEERELIRLVFLFHCYQRRIPDFDALIQAQIGRDAPPAVLRGADLTAELRAYGFSAAETQRFIALFFQLRRAYYFIEQALVGSSQPMRELRRALWNSVFTHDLRSYTLLLWERMEDFSTLLLGETGTGKGSAAAAIGRSGPIPFDVRRNGFGLSFTETFIATNLSQFPESLIESELFGHRKGAFTGAVDHHEGLFGRCDAHGALFLDEIGDVTLPVQTKLLNVLQERRFTPVGSHETRRFQGRVIAATNRSRAELLRDGHFRRDFFYRLSSNIIRVPPLRERLADCPAELGELVDALLARMVGRAAGALREGVMEALDELPRGYPWPGNVRELEQALRRIILNGRYVPDPLPGSAAADPWLAALEAGNLDAAGLLAGYCRRLHARLGTYEAVARVTGLDRRTVKRHIEAG